MAEATTIEFTAAPVAGAGADAPLVLHGESTPVGWRLELTLYPEAAGDDESVLTLVTPDGTSITATLDGGRLSPVTDGAGRVAAAQFALDFAVEAGAHAGGVGDLIHVNGTLAGEGSGTGGSLEGTGALLTLAFVPVDSPS